MKTVVSLIKRNVKLYFRDKGMFFTSLITPMILLVLYATFLSNVYRDSFVSNLPEGVKIADDLIDSLVSGQLISSLLAVSCVTVAFCSNFLMVQDKANGTIKDLRIAPLKPSRLAISYYAATLISTLLICFAATGICIGYTSTIGSYMSASDIMYIIFDVTLLVLFGVALSSVINFFLSSQGQISAVGTVISSGYGFICGAYMPISSFSTGLQKVISFLPGTYGTSLLRNHATQGALSEMKAEGIPDKVIESFKDALDCNIYFFGDKVDIPVMYAVLGGSVALLVIVYVLMNILKKK